MGVSDMPLCGARDFLCQVARRIALANIYSSYVQDNIVTVRLFAAVGARGTVHR